jgi:glutathione S-transferase
MGDLTLYTNPQSRGTTARWMLEEAGVAYGTKVLGFGPAMRSLEFLAINPMGKVPALVHRGAVVTECAAICAYVGDAFPDAGLVPPAGERAAYYRWLFFAAGPVESAIVNRFLGVEVTEEQEGMAGYGSYDRAVAALESGMPSGDQWVAGQSFSAADVYVGSTVIWGLQFGSLPDRPAFRRYADRLQARPAYVRGRELDAADQKALSAAA